MTVVLMLHNDAIDLLAGQSMYRKSNHVLKKHQTQSLFITSPILTPLHYS